jgi:hypothetical protein
MPRWAAKVCECWRRVLDQLESSPESANKTLDWAIKLAFYRDRARRRGIRWESMPYWTYVANNLNYALSGTELPEKRGFIEYLLSRQSPIKNAVGTLTPYLKDNDLSWEDFPSFVALRNELLEIDMRFGQLGEKGIFSALDKAGLLQHRINGFGCDSRGIENPPEIGRARLRGKFVRHNAAEKGRYCCDWEGIWDQQSKRIMDLSDPFETEERWRNLTEAEMEFGPEFGVFALRARFRRPRQGVTR